MKISVISAIALGGAFLLTAPVTYAGPMGDAADCPPGTSRSGDGTCLMSSGSLEMAGASYGGSSYTSGTAAKSYAPSTSYSSGYTSRTYGGSSSSSDTPRASYYSSNRSSSNCPAGSTRTTDGVCLVQGGSSSSMGSSSYTSFSGSTPSHSNYSYSSTPLHSYHGQSSYVIDNRVSSTMSDSEADYRYGSGSISQTYTDGSNTIVPFTTTNASLTNYRVAGMGSNEFLSPTNCPVSVYNPGGAKVIGCYQVSKPAPRPVFVPSYHHVQVVRPIIYVRYPVPVAAPICRSTHWHSRYGKNWPRGGCRW